MFDPTIKYHRRRGQTEPVFIVYNINIIRFLESRLVIYFNINLYLLLGTYIE